MVFQNYALYPHMSVRNNLAFPLKMMKVHKKDIEKKVAEVAGLLQLGDYINARPGHLSGGQRQRVAMGRALVREPAVFLMDEPLSNLDAKLRVQMRSEITDLQTRLGTTTIYVTHDQVEAMTMGDRLAVIKGGVLQQTGRPQEIYIRPANVFVATFIGSPGMNLVWTRMSRNDSGKLGFDLGGTHLSVPEDILEKRDELRRNENRDLIVGLRPESFTDPGNVPESQRIEARISHTEEMGHEFIAYFKVETSPLPRPVRQRVASDASGTALGKEESKTTSDQLTMVARLPPAMELQREQTATLGVDTGQCYLFDDRGDAIAGGNDGSE
jgi:multiple sugar transport system ATP-binding protein